MVIVLAQLNSDRGREILEYWKTLLGCKTRIVSLPNPIRYKDATTSMRVASIIMILAPSKIFPNFPTIRTGTHPIRHQPTISSFSIKSLCLLEVSFVQRPLKSREPSLILL
jgi:hypothetical protein